MVSPRLPSYRSQRVLSPGSPTAAILSADRSASGDRFGLSWWPRRRRKALRGQPEHRHRGRDNYRYLKTGRAGAEPFCRVRLDDKITRCVRTMVGGLRGV